MENNVSVYKKLMDARIALQNTNLKKSGKNTFANYSYFELSDFLPAIQNIFHDKKLAGVVSFGLDLATLTIVDLEDGSEIKITSPMSSAALKGCHEVQNLGAVQTYIRRYLWVSALEIVEHDAIDSAQPVEPKPKRATKSKAELVKLINEASSSEILAVFWKALTPDERELVRTEAAHKGAELKGAKDA
jgi:hypothetical protein